MIETNCNLCGGDDYFVRFPATLANPHNLDVAAFRCTSNTYGSHAQVVQCKQCGYVYANPRWSPDELLEAYTAVEDEVYEKEREGRELTFRKHLQALEKVIGPAQGRCLLDVGAYIGVFVEVAQVAGWQAMGVEPSTWAAAAARQRNLNIIEGTLDAPELQGQQFDLITMWDVIEHVADPASEIAKSYQLLKPGGTLVLHTMDIDSLFARLMGSRWPWLMDMHIHFFSQKTMADMLCQKGFQVIWSGAQGRYLRLGYFATRIEALSRPLGRLARFLIATLRLQEVAIPLNFGDLFTVYAERPLDNE